MFVTLEQSRVLSGLSPPLQISQSVVPKPHLSVAKLRFWGFSMHSGGTHGIRSTRTDGRTRGDTEAHRENFLVNVIPTWHYAGVRSKSSHIRTEHVVYLTFSGQHSDADTRVTQFDEGHAARRPILLSDQKNILGTNISMNEVLILLCADMTGTT